MIPTKFKKSTESFIGIYSYFGKVILVVLEVFWVILVVFRFFMKSLGYLLKSLGYFQKSSESSYG